MAHCVGERTGQPLLNQLFVMPLHRAEAREQTVNNAMQLQIYKQIFLLGNFFQSAQDARPLLESENKGLRQQIIQRMKALEEEWLGAAEQVSAKVDAIYFKFSQLDREITAEYGQEARSICDLLVKGATVGEFDQVLKGEWSKIGAAQVTRRLCNLYSFRTERYMNSWEELHLNVRGSLKALVKNEIPKNKIEMLPEELIVGDVRDLQKIDAFNVNDAVLIDIGAVFQAFTQMRLEEIQTLDEYNDVIRKKNEGLKNKIIELENMNKMFSGIAHKYLYSYLKLRGQIEDILKRWESVKDYPERLAELNTQWGGYCKKGIELHTKYSPRLNEIAVLTEALNKELTL